MSQLPSLRSPLQYDKFVLTTTISLHDVVVLLITESCSSTTKSLRDVVVLITVSCSITTKSLYDVVVLLITVSFSSSSSSTISLHDVVVLLIIAWLPCLFKIMQCWGRSNRQDCCSQTSPWVAVTYSRNTGRPGSRKRVTTESWETEERHWRGYCYLCYCYYY